MSLLTLSLSGIMTGDSLSISVSQNAITAGPINISTWGQTGGANAGPITINVFQSTSRLNPESVGLTVDLDGSSFDTAAPVGDEIYDARMHHLVYIWDYDDAAHPTWSAPENVLTGWNNRNRGIGPSVQHVYLDPRPASLGAGNGYNPGVLVIEPSSGKWASTTVELFVEDQEAFYSGNNSKGHPNTILVNEDGDNDWTYADANYPDAEQLNASSFHEQLTAINPDRWLTDPFRVLFKRGGSFTVALWVSSVHSPPLYFGDYGEPSDPRPILNGTQGGTAKTERMFRLQAIDWGSGTVTPEYRFQNLDIRGNWDDEVWGMGHENDDTDMYFINSTAEVDMVVQNCRIDGFRIAHGASIGGQVSNPTDPINRKSRFHWDDVYITDFGGQYPILVAACVHPESSWSMTGSSFKQSPGGTTYTFGTRNRSKGNGSLFRVESAARFYGACIDMLTKDGLYAAIKPNNTGYEDGHLLNFHHMYCEGGYGMVTQGTNSIADVGDDRGPGHRRSHVSNAIYDGMLFIGAENCVNPFQTMESGFTLRNALYIQPSTKRWVNGHSAFLNLPVLSSNTTPSPPAHEEPYTALPDYVRNAPIEMYNCGIGYFLDQSVYGVEWLKDAVPPVLWQHGDDTHVDKFTNVIVGNNFIHAPDCVTPYTADGPFTSNVLWAPQITGVRFVTTLMPSLDQGRYSPPSDVPDGGTMFIPYGRLYVDNQGGPQQQSHFTGTQGQAMLVNESNGRVYYEAGDASYLYNLAIEVSYDATGVTITNTSGETWPAAHKFFLEADMGSSAPLLTDWAPKTPYVDCKPTGASPMLGSASTSEGPVAFLDIHGDLRGSAGVYTLPANVDKGPWQVS